ncbi:MAG: hypothetical protein ACRDJ9_10485 [Dehalococcoidia bacterium]
MSAGTKPRRRPTRKSVPLTAELLDALDPARTPGTAEHDALATLTGLDPATGSEAEILAVMVDLGWRQLRESIHDAAYAELAAAEDEEEPQARRDIRDRAAAIYGPL